MTADASAMFRSLDGPMAKKTQEDDRFKGALGASPEE